MTTRRQDIRSIVLLIILWVLFFWRLLTPIAGDQASVTRGDFSGQFFTFASYQYDRLTTGEVPLWNPYNNGGLPFLADTQAAVFYPPRLLTIALSNLSGGWHYHALELEMAVHVLVFSLLMYLLVRRMTLKQAGSSIGALVAAIIACYGGFLSGYPVQQLAILEAAIWLPLAVSGVFEATRSPKLQWHWLVLAGVALGLSWMAGHPQTSWFLTYLITAYLAYRVAVAKRRWTYFAGGILLVGLVTGGIAAVQLLPGFEYLAHTARVDLTYEAKGNGFPFRDVLQMLFPGELSLFSPLYMGIGGLALVLCSLWIRRRIQDSTFWLLVALISLGLSFGANSAIFPTLYNLLPGLRFFRGQERAAYLVVNSLAILAGLTLTALMQNNLSDNHPRRAIRFTLIGMVAFAAAGIFLSSSGWLNPDSDTTLNTAVFSTGIAVGVLVILWGLIRSPRQPVWPWLFIGLLVFDLFTINMDADHSYDPVPPTEQISLTPPPVVATAQADQEGYYRVDGFRGLTDNYGSLYQVMDMRGISPLYLDGPFQLIEPEKINPLAWELFAVRDIFTDWDALPVPSQIIATGEDRYGPVNLHRLDNPRPFAHLVYAADIIDGDAFARELLRNTDFDPRHTIILNREPGLELVGESTEPGTAEVVSFEPERIVIAVATPANAILSLAHPDYLGWQATVDDSPTEIIRAYGALSAIPVPTGEHEIVLTYDPLSYRIGAILSLVTWAGLGILGILWLFNSRKRDAHLE